PGGGIRYRVGRLTRQESDDLWAHADVVDGVLTVLHGGDTGGHPLSDDGAEGDETAGDTPLLADADLAVQWLMLAGHPWVSYTDAGVRTWTTGLAYSVAVDPTVLGVPKRGVPAARRQLTEWGALPGA